jgi:hypothetical protein
VGKALRGDVMNDTVYFNSNVASTGQDWVHCKVLRYDAAGVLVEEKAGFGGATQQTFYPAHNIQRVVRK